MQAHKGYRLPYVRNWTWKLPTCACHFCCQMPVLSSVKINRQCHVNSVRLVFPSMRQKCLLIFCAHLETSFHCLEYDMCVSHKGLFILLLYIMKIAPN